MPDFPPLDCSEVVYRTVFHKNWIKSDGSYRWQAFKPYLNDKDGVSVFIEPSDIDEHSEKPYFGIISVKVGRIRDCSTEKINLDIIQDETWHANIKIPYHYDEDGNENMEKRRKMMDYCEAIVNSNALRNYEEQSSS